MNTIVVSIGERSGGKRKVTINHDQPHDIDETEITTLLKKADESWHYDPVKAAALGTGLFSLLNGHKNRLRELISQKLTVGDINLILDIHKDLDTLPFEMIRDNCFLALESPVHILRRGGEKLTAVTIPDRHVRILFMACSPDNVPANARLSFETEEEFIYQAARTLPLELRVVDSGSLAALQEELNQCLYADGTNKYDVIHISCHGAIDGELGPVLYMEDEMGYLDKVTPGRLWEALKDFPPRVLFLSACSTARYDRLHNSGSFGERMCQKGIPYCLGWNNPVGDTQASFFAASFYKHCAQGMNIVKSVQKARVEVKNHLESWPISRFFIDNTEPAPLIRFTSRIIPLKPREILYDYLGRCKVKVLKTGFTGRRRQIWEGIRTLNGSYGAKGIIITGPAGVGKSCLAGKIMERIQDTYGHNRVIIKGKVDAGDILSQLADIFDRQGCKKGLEIIEKDESFPERMKELFRGVLKDGCPVLFYFDDFEQNLIRKGNDWYVAESGVEVIAPFILSLNWCESKSNLIITSRYPFMLDETKEDRVKAYFITIPMMEFRGADLLKLQENCNVSHIARSLHRSLYVDISKGNPRLLETLDVIAGDEKEYDIDKLEEKCLNREQEYITDYLIDIITQTEDPGLNAFLSKAAVYCIPVTSHAYSDFGDTSLLEKSTALTLMEKEAVLEREPVYWINPFIRHRYLDTLQASELCAVHERAFNYYDTCIKEEKAPDISYSTEAVRHGIACNRITDAIPHARTAAEYYNRRYLYAESLHILTELTNRLDDAFIRVGIQNKNLAVGYIFHDVAIVYNYMCEWEKALEYYLKSEKITIEVGDKAGLRTTYNNIGLIYSNKGEWEKALEYYLKSEKIKIEVGDKEGLAPTYNNIGSIYSKKGEWEKALEYYLKSEKIKIEVGDKAGLGITYINIGGIYYRKGEWEKALEYFLKSEKITIEVGNKADLAPTYNNIGSIYFKKGEWEKALEYYRKAENIVIEVGDKTGLGTTYNNIGAIYDKKGEWEKALEYYLKSEKIRIEVGDKAGLAYTTFNISSVYMQKEEFEPAIIYGALCFFIGKKMGMNHELAQMAWFLDVIREQVGEDELMRLGQEMAEKRGIVWI